MADDGMMTWRRNERFPNILLQYQAYTQVDSIICPSSVILRGLTSVFLRSLRSEDLPGLTSIIRTKQKKPYIAGLTNEFTTARSNKILTTGKPVFEMDFSSIQLLFWAQISYKLTLVFIVLTLRFTKHNLKVHRLKSHKKAYQSMQML